jgi:transcriptional regulator with XRE-family HTH domain
MKSLSRDVRWSEARKNLREWLMAHKKNQSELARLAGLNRSVVNRFLVRDQPLSASTATKLFSVLKVSMDPVERQQWMEWLNLEETNASLSKPLVSEEMPITTGVYPNIETGYYWLNMAWDILRQGTNKPACLPMFAQAELAFGRYSTMAALAGCEIIQQYINLGHLARAEREVFRVETTYLNVMDVQTRREFLQLKGMTAYDHQDYARALQAVDELIVMEKEYGFSTLHQHIAGLSQLKLAERLGDADPERQRLLGMAEENMRFMCLDAERINYSLHIGFMSFRLAQILREQGRYTDAAHLRKKVQRLFIGELSAGHLAIEDANLALMNGETTRARAKAEATRDGWQTIFYAAGLGRADAIIAQSLLMEGCAEEALEPAVVAASIAPHEACYKGDQFVDLPWQIRQIVCRNMDGRQYAALIAQIQEHVHLQSGHFASLAHVVPDRSGAALALLAKLAANHASTPASAA